mmetsp:Transcript_85559/g.169804  ORF Transcript_85559/g.169804 Transcript_85559/m.169804 type:complete len:124 (+) Transcript_85559:337-708(+)
MMRRQQEQQGHGHQAAATAGSIRANTYSGGGFKNMLAVSVRTPAACVTAHVLHTVASNLRERWKLLSRCNGCLPTLSHSFQLLPPLEFTGLAQVAELTFHAIFAAPTGVRMGTRTASAPAVQL